MKKFALTLSTGLLCLGIAIFTGCSTDGDDSAANVTAAAQEPKITAQPQKAVYTQDAVVTPLQVSAEVTDGGTLTYQWYTTDGITSDEAITGAESAEYTPPVSEVGTIYYYVVVTNTTSAGKAARKSDVTKVTVNAPGAVLAKVSFAVAASAEALQSAALTEFTEDKTADFAAGLAAAINGAAGGWSADEPVYVKINGFDVGDMADLAILYGNLSPSKFVDLDLSGCHGNKVPIAQGTDAYKAQKQKITGITYPASVETVEDCADWSGAGGGLAIPYKNFNALKRVSLPGALYIGNRAFYKITTLETLEAPKARTIGPYAFGDATPANGNKLTALNLPEVRNIYDNAFQASNKLQTVELPKVEYIGDSAFSVTSANLDLTATLTELDLPNVLEIGAGTTATSGAFSGRPIEEVNLPKLVKFAGFSTTAPFIAAAITAAISAGGNPLAEVLRQMPAVKVIGAYAFYNVLTLTGNITIPEGITEIGDNAFYGCTNIESVTGANVVTIGTSAFSRVNSTASAQPAGALTGVNFPNAVTVKDKAFQYQRWLATVILPKVKTIEGNAFGMSGSSSTASNAVLTSISLPQILNLGSVISGSPNGPFVYCTELETIELGTTVPVLVSTSTFGTNTVKASCHIDVPAASLTAYEDACAASAKGWTSALASKLQAITE